MVNQNIISEFKHIVIKLYDCSDNKNLTPKDIYSLATQIQKNQIESERNEILKEANNSLSDGVHYIRRIQENINFFENFVYNESLRKRKDRIMLKNKIIEVGKTLIGISIGVIIGTILLKIIF